MRVGDAVVPTDKSCQPIRYTMKNYANNVCEVQCSAHVLSCGTQEACVWVLNTIKANVSYIREQSKKCNLSYSDSYWDIITKLVDDKSKTATYYGAVQYAAHRKQIEEKERESERIKLYYQELNRRHTQMKEISSIISQIKIDLFYLRNNISKDLKRLQRMSAQRKKTRLEPRRPLTYFEKNMIEAGFMQPPKIVETQQQVDIKIAGMIKRIKNLK